MARMDEKPDDLPMSLSTKFKVSLREAQQFLNTDLRDLFKKEGRLIDDEFLAELRAILIRTDMGPLTAGMIVDELHRQCRGRKVCQNDILAIIKTKLLT
jgi:fused signal recognition particle receptor